MTAPQLTPAQARASTPAKHVWVDASAGTGKTHVLAARVLRLMLAGTAAQSILCLTYTNAAAGEMSNRILKRLGDWAILPEADLRLDLAGLLGGTSLVDDITMARARRLFVDVLDLPNGLNIQTFHGFSTSLLGRFPIEAGTPPGFETLEGRSQLELRHLARDDVLAQAVGQPSSELADDLQMLAQLLADKTFEDTLNKLAEMDLSRVGNTRREVNAHIHAALNLDPRQSSMDIRCAACARQAFDKDALEGLVSVLEDCGSDTEKRKIAVPVERWINAPEDERVESFEAYAASFFTAKGLEPLKKPINKKTIEKAPHLLDVINAETERVKAVMTQLRLKSAAERTLSAIRFGQALNQSYNRQKAATGMLDFGDLIDRAKHLLTTAAAPGWVMFKLDTQIEHLLIDEAQDNSADQWRIIDAVTEEFFAGHGQTERPRSLFAVGDMKQSIYGFQGAAPDLFEEYRSRFRASATQVGQSLETVALNLSFRSVQAVLDVVDATFQGEAREGLDMGRDTLEHKSHRKGVGGMVDLWPILTPPKKEKTEINGWHMPLEPVNEVKADRAMAERIAQDIAERIARRETLPGRSAPLSAGDFLVLVRRRNDFVGHLVRALKRRGVPLAGVDRFNLLDPLVIRDLLNVARFACLPSDDYALACVLKGPLCDISENDLMALCAQRTGSLLAHLQDQGSRHPDIVTFLKGVLKRADFQPPFEFFSQLLNDGGRKALQSRLGLEAEDAINVFLEQCLAYERDHAPSLNGFIHWLTQSDVDVKRDAEAAGDKVRLMTIHAAKGLQAPVVYLPDLVGLPDMNYPFVGIKQGGAETPIYRKNKDGDVGPIAVAKAARQQRDYNEVKRLIYVAMTRAEDHLICCGYKGSERSQNSSLKDGYTLIEEGFERLETPETCVHNSGFEFQRFACAQTEPVQVYVTDKPLSPQAALPDWAHRPAPSEQTPPRPLQPSQSDIPEPMRVDPARPQGIDAARRGKLIHNALEVLPELAAGERASAAARYFAAAARDLPEDTRQALAKQALDTLDLEALAHVFGPHSRAEVPITARLGSYVVSGQIDRLVVEPDEVMYLDYKTSQLPPKTLADVPRAYLRQMALYGASLAQIYPDKTIRGALVWTATGKVMQLDLGDLMPHLPAQANSAFTATSP